ncbi:MAG: polysaccharide biosynthesis tyrosine autokinase [Qipengyuania sp.]|uniref:GumC family protein n=1 Tax=Qipengyuania sp. TaxID=2004515 RepID=UPI003001B941
MDFAEKAISQTRLVGLEQNEMEAEDTSLINFLELRAAVTRNLRWIVIAIGLILALAAVLTVLAIPMYRASTTLEVDAKQSNVLAVQDVEAEVTARETNEFLQTQLEILRSRSIATAVAEDLGFFNNDEFLVTMNVAPPSEELSARALITSRRDKVIDVLLSNQEVKLLPQSRIVRIDFTSPDPALAANVANSYARNYIQNNLTNRFNVNSYARKFVGEQLGQAREDLEESERKLNNYARASGLVALSSSIGSESQATLTNSTITQMNQQLVEAQSDRISSEQAWNAVRNSPPLSIPAVYSNPAVSVLLRRRAELRAAVAEASSRYVEDAPQVVEVKSELAQIEAEINTLATEIKNSIERSYQATVGRENQIRLAMENLTSQQQNEQSLGVQYNILNREVATNRAVYDGLLQRYRELTASAGLAGNSISVVDDATPPRVPYAPEPVRNMALAFLLGIVVASVVVFLREQIFQRIRTPDDVRRFLKLPLLVAVPYSDTQEISEALEENTSPPSEAMSTLTSVLSLSSERGAPASLFITSTRSAEGKSTANFSIAKNLARRGKNVLIIDADLRRPNVHRLVKIKNEIGLSEVLSGQEELPAVVLPRNEERDFDVVVAGQIPPNPVDLLSSPRFQSVITQAKSVYDHVIVDGPPVLGLSDALIISSKVDATVLAIESNALRPSQVRETVQRLRQSSNSIIGAILTKFQARRNGYEYSYGDEAYVYEN